MNHTELLELIRKHKTYLLNTQDEEELYKWNAISHFQTVWDIKAKDFSVMFLDSFKKRENLFYQNSWGFISKAVNKFPETIREMLRNLFDENLNLDRRIAVFGEEADKLLPKLKKELGRQNLNHQQDERSISIYLAMRYPEKYYFYMATFYSEFCMLMDENMAVAGNRYSHYFQLAQKFKEVYVNNDPELLQLHRKYHPAVTWDDSNLLVQNILFTNLSQKQTDINFLLANITWNSNDWKGLSKGDKTGHRWVKKGGTAGESWNFDFENPRNKKGIILGYSKFTHAPKVTKNNNLIIFFSDNKIVGFYGKTEVLSEAVSINKEEAYNLKASKHYCIALNTIIDRVKEKGYLEDKERVGMIGFNYIQHNQTVNKILDEAKQLNPDQQIRLQAIQDWVNNMKNITDTNSYWIFQCNPKFYNIKEALLNNHVSSWRVSTHKNSIKIGDKFILWVTGETPGCYALGEIASPLYKRNGKEIDDQYYKEPGKQGNLDGVKILIDHNLADHPVLWKDLKTLEGFDDFNGGNQGTNFIANQQQYETIRRMIMDKKPQVPLNLILYGPPGTGKTFSTINHALSIIEEKSLDEIKNENRVEIKKRFDEYLNQGQIEFITFHQSMSYEDFIEGIKPTISETGEIELKYIIEDGLFKRISASASEAIKLQKQTGFSNPVIEESLLQNSQFFKLSLGNSQNPEDDDIFQYCVDNSCIAIGWGDQVDFSGANTEQDLKRMFEEHKPEMESKSEYGLFAIKCLKFGMKQDDIVFISNGMRKLKAIAKIDGDYSFNAESRIRYHQFRKVKWLYTDLDIPVNEVYGSGFSQQTIYYLYNHKVKTDFFRSKPGISSGDVKKYVLVIDEINRGNIANIFGELITLIEDDKRAGANEQIEISLPYSKQKFSVPSNLYIIGTMNTADRSVEALDTALRRRFSFVEMMPRYDLHGLEFEPVPGISLSNMLKMINVRLEKLLDKDHMIGHSYFLSVKSTVELKSVFYNKIIPLLQEYFYGDPGKMALVLGNGFFEVPEHGKREPVLAKITWYDAADDLEERFIVHIKNVMDMSDYEFITAIEILMNKPKNDFETS